MDARDPADAANARQRCGQYAARISCRNDSVNGMFAQETHGDDDGSVLLGSYRLCRVLCHLHNLRGVHHGKG